MQRNLRILALVHAHEDEDDHCELAALFHPAGTFAHPVDVVHDPDLTPAEKRAILSSWAARICAVNAIRTGDRQRTSPPVTFDEVADALHHLQRARSRRPKPHPQQVLAPRAPDVIARRQPSTTRRRTSLN